MASFYRDAAIEVTESAVKTASETYPLEQIANLKAEKRFWWRGAAALLFLAALLWLPIAYVAMTEAQAVMDSSPGGNGNWGRLIGFVVFVPCGFLLIKSAKLLWSKQYHLTLHWHFSGMSGFAFVDLAQADELAPLEKIATAIREAQAALSKAG